MNIRNIAIIAHVDHGKTTLVDGMLKQTHTFRDNEAEMSQTTILDSNALEREKGITILAKNTSVQYKDVKINIIDTPGHADFSGEVERVINMADGALLVIDAAEGPLPQTQFVLQKALEHNLKIIVVVNKIDRKDARPQEVLRETEELILHMAHHEKHLDFPVLYAVGRQGKAWENYPADMDAPGDLSALFEAILTYIPAPVIDPSAGSGQAKPFKMLVSTLDFDSHKGSFAIGKVGQGSVAPGQRVLQMLENEKLGEFKVIEVFTSVGLKRVPAAVGETGDIIAVTGIADVGIGQTLTDPADPIGFPMIHLEEPTLKILVAANTSPFAGREGTFSTARQIHQRLLKEKQTNIGIRITENPDGTGFIVAGRGELHLAILFENLRREGYEFQVGKPEVILKKEHGVTQEPFEEMTIEIDNTYVGVISEELGRRKSEMLDTHTNERGVTKMVYKVSSRNLLGFRGDILTKTRGNGIFAARFIGYFPMAPHISKLRNGVLVAIESGKSSGYALTTVQERGRAFIGPGIPVYEGMIVGVNNRAEDIVDFIEDDELLEITPEALRLRKRNLTKGARVKAKRHTMSIT
ncbi:MAG: GTP-binding protein TypA [Microgenomates group bacterium GW2011_GWA2_47_8]|nr:MAG: GTP-binding protein TypA [Microgenomates group bacterium GW2011_GWA2_47_8]